MRKIFLEYLIRMRGKVMSKQIIFCVETNGKARTDIVYIKDTIRKFYNDYSGINFEYVPMGTKTAFNNKKTKADIRKYIKNNPNGTSHIVYCIDTDQFECNQEQLKLNKSIEDFCLRNGYKLIWFCHDIEEVYIGKSVRNKDKVSISKRFKRKGEIEKVDENKLRKDQQTSGHSNILNVIDSCLK